MLRRPLCSFVSNTRQSEHLRTTDPACVSAFNSKNVRILPMSKDKKPLIKDRSIAWTGETKHFQLDKTVFLGLDQEDKVPLFAGEVEDELKMEKEVNGQFMHIMRATFTIKDKEKMGHILSRAYALLKWHSSFLFCSGCGHAPLTRSVSGHKRECSKCNKVFYPSPQPVINVLIVDKDKDKILLISQPNFPPGLYSCPAGFVDAGETIEQAVHREVAEELGVKVKNLRFEDASSGLASMHWPGGSPGSLMIGCLAELSDLDLDPDPKEVSEARWFTSDEVRVTLKGQGEPGLILPRRGALAHALISRWLSNSKY